MKFISTLFAVLLACVLFSVSSNAQTITIIQPNGGEILYSCQQYNVTWSQTGVPSNYWNIDYSLDGGTIWTSVASNYLSTNGSFMWTVPTVQSNTVLMRVFDANNPIVVDQSNNFFTINIPVIVTAPNGGETWQGNTVQNITWNTIGTSNTFNLAYSLNNGTTWTNIITNYSSGGGTYAWTVPSVNTSTQCLVRVMDAVTNCMQDVSNTVFTITPPTPQVTYPNGGEQLYASCAIVITWNPASYFSNVQLEYSLNGGASFTVITTNTSNDGTYSWTPPSTPDNEVRVRVCNVDNLSINDVSNANFTLLPTITVVSPNGGEDWTTCSTYNVVVDYGPCISNIGLQYSTDNGTTWNSMSLTLVSTSGNQRTYSWIVPNTIGTDDILIRAYDAFNSTTVDQSDAIIDVTANAAITLLTPNGGESIDALSSYNITWSNTAAVSGLYTIQFSVNNGASWSSIVTSVSGNSYNWTVNNSISTQCLIRVIDAVNTCYQDQSNSVFSIAGLTSTLTYPNGGETFYAGCASLVTWNSSTYYNNVRIEYSSDGGTTWTVITTSTSNDGNYSWTTPNITGTNFLVRVSQSDNLLFTDVSDAVFTMVPHISITSPVGGETWTTCTTQTVTLNYQTSCVNAVGIQYSVDGGITWNGGSPFSLTTSNGNVHTYSWQIPNTITVSTILMRAYDAFNSTYVDITDGAINIVPNNIIAVTSANGGESLAALSQHLITWTNTAQASGLYNVYYSSNNGSTWISLASSVSGNAYNWTVANTPSVQCLIRVQDAVNTCVQDVSNAVFTITPQAQVMTSPNGGETFYAGCASLVTWNSSTYYNNVRIEYSSDGGTTWTVITTSTSNDGNYSWTTPNITGTNFLVRVSQSDNLLFTDVSDAVFTMVPHISITSPVGGETWTTCTTQTVTLNYQTSCVNAVGIQYSVDGGITWNGGSPFSLTTSNGNVHTYSWQIPNTITVSTILMRAYDAFNSTYVDITDGAINIVPNNIIAVTSPNGGESLAALSQHLITWTNTAQASGLYNVYYSSNNGSTWISLASSVSGNAYNWTVANTPSVQCLIRVQDAVNTCVQDVSNAVFTITPQAQVMTSPNGGETFYAGCASLVTWNSSTYYNNVRIEYSSDGGTTWTVITTSTSNDGNYSWTTPNITGTNFLVRVSQSDNLLFTDVSDAVFTMVPHISITSPVGGETWTTCTTQTVTLNYQTSCVNAVGIQYSVDGGITWNGGSPFSLTTSNGNVHTYSWQIPNTITVSTILMRAYDAFNSTYVDITDGAINIVPNNIIAVTSPNGGESLAALSQHLITWTNTAQASGLYNVYYSSNNGSTWISLASSVSGNAYNWTVANTPSVQCLIRVQDAVNTCVQDVSNAVFTITPQAQVMTSPNGGETFYAGCASLVTWNSSTYYNNVRIEYSSDGGTTWTVITTSTSNDGNYSWTTPNITGTNFLVRVSQSDNLLFTDVSDAVFTMVPHISITSPVGGETWTTCTTQTVTLNYQTSCVNAVGIQYSVDGGITWNGGSPFSLTTSNGNVHTYSWQIPNTITVSTILMRAYDAFNSTYVDITDGAINIVPNNIIAVTSPNGGESLAALSQHLITWTNTAQASGLYNVYYSSNNGSTWISLASSVSGNAYNWTVANTPSVQCLIRVQDAVNTCVQDVSNAVFTIIPQQASLISPNGGEIIYSQNGTLINWDNTTFYNNVRLEYSLDGGLTWIVITTSTSNDGNYTWTPPQADSDQCLVRVSQTDNLNQSDESDNFFTIRPAATIITPNGDNGITIWGGCTVTSITFDHSPAFTSFRLEYSINNGVTWSLITNSYNATANPATYNWTMPNSPTSQALVRVSPTSNLSYFDISDDTFTITKPVTIIQPNFGGIMQVGSTFNIQWTSDGISNIYDIFYSTDGGTNFTNITTGYNTSNNTYPWLVPNIPSSNCRIWVRDNINNCKSDTSDVAFVISTTAPPLTISTPNGIADTLIGCAAFTISWTESSDISNYDIAYSLNNGSTWNDIVTNYNAPTNSYDWVVPNTINSTTVLIRVRSTAQPMIYDLTDAYINIQAGELIALPEFVSECSNIPIQLSATGGSNYTWSPSTGLSNSLIPNPVAMPLSTTTYTVTSDVGGCVLSDEVTIEVTESGVPAVIIIESDQILEICEGTLVTFNASIESGGASPQFQWKVNGLNAGNNSSEFATTTLNNGDIVTCVLTSDLACVSNNPATSNEIQLTVLSEVIPSVTINSSTGNIICNGQSVVFSANPIHGGTNPNYTWTLNGDPVGTDSPTLEGLVLANNDNIGLTMTSNDICLSSSIVAAPFIMITVGEIPAQPGVISGEMELCAGAISLFSITEVVGATDYEWSVPQGWSVSDMGLMINAIAGNNSGEISVVASNSCGSSNVSTIFVDVITIPESPLMIDGPISVCNGSIAVYNVESIAGATSYEWSLASGWNGSSNSESISVDFGLLSDDGLLTVAASNECGSSILQTLAISVGGATALPSVISGNATPCESAEATYVIDDYFGAISYVWTLPINWSGSSSGTSIDVTNSGVSGQISVYAVTACGNSPERTLNVNIQSVPVLNSQIEGENVVCANENYVYFVAPVSDTDNYEWTIPQGWNITENLNSIEVLIGTVGGTIEVFASNECGVSESMTLDVATIEIPASPSNINGPNAMCENEEAQFSIEEVAGATNYTWTLVSGWSGSSATDFIEVVAGEESGLVSVTANNQCGSSSPAVLEVSITALPMIQTNTLVGESNVCVGSSQEYSIDPVSGADSYAWNFPGGWVGSSNNASIQLIAGDLDGFISVTASNECGNGNTATIAVSIDEVLELSAIEGLNVLCENESEVYSVLSAVNADSYSWTAPAGWSIVGSGSSVSVTVNDLSGELSVSGINSCGVSNTVDVLVIVNTLPEITATVLPSPEICEGEQITLFGNGGEEYSWTLGAADGVAFIPGASNAYVVTGTDANNCMNTAEIDIIVQNLPEVDLLLLGDETQCLETASVALGGGTPIGGEYSGEGVVGTSFFPDVAGLGTAIVTYSYSDENGCSASASDAYVVEICDIVLEAETSSFPLIYPNPAKDQFYIESSQNMEIRIVDFSGRTVWIGSIQGKQRIDAADWASGLYAVFSGDGGYKSLFID